jgi:molybdate transport system substrate-binding protein
MADCHPPSAAARIKAGEMADVAILTREGIDGAGRARHPGERHRRRSRALLVGIAVKAGTRKPDIGTPDALQRALLEAQSIAYSRIGASGVFFAQLIERLGIADA